MPPEPRRAPTYVPLPVSGHSHKPCAEKRVGMLFVSAGSARPRRFSLLIAAGEIIVNKATISARTMELVQRPSASGAKAARIKRAG